MRISIGSYIKANDLSSPMRVTISALDHEEIGQEKEMKYVLSFKETSKKLILNTTNTKALIALFTDESDSWVGKTVILYADQVMFSGSMVPCVRIRASKAAGKPATPPPADECETEDNLGE